MSSHLPMVTKRSTANLGFPRQAPSKSSFKFIKDAFTYSFTIYPLDRDSIPETYTPSLLFLFVISLILAGVFMANTVKNLNILNNIIPIMSQLAAMILLIFISYSVICYLFSFIGSLILGIPHSSKQYSINASSFTFVVVSFILSPLMPSGLSEIPRLAALFLMSYYIGVNYKPYYSPEDDRMRTIHGIYIFLGYLSVLYISSQVVYTGYEFIKNII